MASYHPDGWSIDSLVGASSSERLKSAARGLVKTFCWPELLELLRRQGTGSTYRDVFEFARFLLLCATTSGGSAVLSPSGRINIVWHTALLFPTAYASSCESMGVGIIEHFPLRAYEGNGARAGRLSRTRSAYVHAFGSEPPAECWRDQEYKREAQRPSGASTPSASASPMASPRASPVDTRAATSGSKRTRDDVQQYASVHFEVRFPPIPRAHGAPASSRPSRIVLHVPLNSTIDQVARIAENETGIPAIQWRIQAISSDGRQTLKESMTPGDDRARLVDSRVTGEDKLVAACAEKIQVFTRWPDGDATNFTVSPFTRMHKLADVLAQREDFPPGVVVAMFFYGRRLDAKATFFDIDARDGDRIDVCRTA